jgi:tRNA A-37 threonylcarbamoyl transferase component Bud32
MRNLKDGLRAHVRLDWTNHVHKRFRGTGADERYATEVEVLKALEERGCPNVPRIVEEHPEELYFVTTSCGKPASSISKRRAAELFAELEQKYGVRHLDAETRNITYDPQRGEFCIIDFELAEILPDPRAADDATGPTPLSGEGSD